MRSTFLACAMLGALLALAGAVFFQGIGGAFLIDDYPNLEGLSLIDSSAVIDGAVQFALTGISSPLGRPLALITFAAQYASWPSNPEDFIYVNVLLHLLNGALLFAICLRLLVLVRAPVPAAPVPIALAALVFWLLAAPQLAAVLYVVQRMVLLSATCMFAGFWLYLAGRQREIEGRARSGFALMLAGIAVGTGLGYLAKETAALFPLLVLVIEHTLLRETPRSRAWQRFSMLCLAFPAAVVLAQLSSYAWRAGVYEGRDFSLTERLLTESRVLFMYLDKALRPTSFGVRLYYDDLPVSRSWLEPWTTALSLAGWIALIAAAAVWRRRQPVFAFAVTWYLAAHLLEASVIPLELAFDHRNYVPLVGPALAVGWYGWLAVQAPCLRRLRPLAIAAFAGYAVLLGGATFASAALWGKPWELAHFWARQQPDSRRAQLSAGKVYWHYNQPALAMESQERALQRWPGDVTFFLSMLEIGCAFAATPTPDLQRLPGIVARFDATLPGAVGLLDSLVTKAETGQCKRYTPAELWAVTAMTFEAPRMQADTADRRMLQARIAELAHDRATARALLDEELAVNPRPTGYMLYIAADWALQAGDLACADHYAARFERGEVQHAQGFALRKLFSGVALRRARLAADPAARSRPGDLPSCQNVAMSEPA